MKPETTIYTEQRTYTLLLSKTDGDVNAIPLGFQAKSIKVSNFSSNWLYLPDVSDFVPPYALNIVYCARTGVQTVKWLSPYEYEVPIDNGAQAIIQWLEYELPPTPISLKNAAILGKKSGSLSVTAAQALPAINYKSGVVRNLSSTVAVNIGTQGSVLGVLNPGETLDLDSEGNLGDIWVSAPSAATVWYLVEEM